MGKYIDLVIHTNGDDRLSHAIFDKVLSSLGYELVTRSYDLSDFIMLTSGGIAFYKCDISIDLSKIPSIPYHVVRHLYDHLLEVD